MKGADLTSVPWCPVITAVLTAKYIGCGFEVTTEFFRTTTKLKGCLPARIITESPAGHSFVLSKPTVLG